MQAIISHMRSSNFIKFLEKLTGIPGLVSDPTMFGAGLHQIVVGGVLLMHTDFNRHKEHRGLWRRVNVFLYLNKDWQESWGGHLDLSGGDDTLPDTRISPLMNRMVIFSSSRKSFHGHPDPLRYSWVML
jgi:Rps23 Pro-64 3,4-dihydroxylase Tpa1-like proline 4-hydroxylase